MNNNPLNLIRQALDKNQMTDLLLGAPEYCYLPKYSSSTSATDLAALLGVLYDNCPLEERQETSLKIERAFLDIVKTYEGIEPSSTVILLEALAQKNGNALGLPLEILASDLRNSIAHFRDRLANDKAAGGRNYPDGLLGDLRRLSKNVVDLGGPSFCS